jgi:hypothetical protein
MGVSSYPLRWRHPVKKSAAVAISALFALLASCSPAAPKHTTAWYQAHPADAQQRIHDCDRLGLSDRDADCLNAQQGATLAALHGKSAVPNPYAH